MSKGLNVRINEDHNCDGKKHTKCLHLRLHNNIKKLKKKKKTKKSLATFVGCYGSSHFFLGWGREVSFNIKYEVHTLKLLNFQRTIQCALINGYSSITTKIKNISLITPSPSSGPWKKLTSLLSQQFCLF